MNESEYMKSSYMWTADWNMKRWRPSQLMILTLTDDKRNLKKKNQAWTRLELMTPAIPVQCSNQLSYQANWELVICHEFV